jgi:hypothetical protein
MSIKNFAMLAAITLISLAATPVFAANTARPTAALVEAQARADAAPKAKPGATLDAEAARYAKRETTAKKQQDYRGGDYLVLGISTGAAIVILIIVLLLI